MGQRRGSFSDSSLIAPNQWGPTDSTWTGPCPKPGKDLAEPSWVGSPADGSRARLLMHPLRWGHLNYETWSPTPVFLQPQGCPAFTSLLPLPAWVFSSQLWRLLAWMGQAWKARPSRETCS